MKNKTWKNYLGAAALVTVLFAGSVSAYFTDQDEKVNTFTVGDHLWLTRITHLR